MAEDGAVMEVDLGSVAESGGEAVEQQEAQQSDGAQETESPFSPKTSREFSQWLKGLRETSPETAKFVRMAKDAYSRQYALSQIDPKGTRRHRRRRGVNPGPFDDPLHRSHRVATFEHVHVGLKKSLRGAGVEPVGVVGHRVQRARRRQSRKGVTFHADPPTWRDPVEHAGFEHVGARIDQIGRRFIAWRFLDEGDDTPVGRRRYDPES